MRKFGMCMLSGLCALTMTGMTAQAAEALGQISDVVGNVLVERNGEFFRTDSQSQVQLSDRVIAVDGASAVIKLSPNCSVIVLNNTAITVGALTDNTTEACNAALQVASLDVSDPANALSTSSLALEGSGALIALLAAGAVIAGVVIIADSDDTPSSP